MGASARGQYGPLVHHDHFMGGIDLQAAVKEAKHSAFKDPSKYCRDMCGRRHNLEELREQRFKQVVDVQGGRERQVVDVQGGDERDAVDVQGGGERDAVDVQGGGERDVVDVQGGDERDVVD
eukprot:gene12763-15089_t